MSHFENNENMKGKWNENVSVGQHAEGRETGHSIDRGWDESRLNAVIKGLNEGGKLQEIMEAFPGFKDAFKESLDTMGCSDGRVAAGNKMGFGGPLVLVPEAEVNKFIEANRGKVKTVTAHADCGAAALAFKSLRPEDIPEGVNSSDEYGAYKAKKLADALGAEYAYIDRHEMLEEYHNEVAIVLDQTGRFNSTNLKGFPAHFVSSGAGFGLDAEYMKAEMKILAGIAFGHHGFGDRFDVTEDNANPFYILVSANNQEELDKWVKVADDTAAEFDGKIKVRGFIAPQE